MVQYHGIQVVTGHTRDAASAWRDEGRDDWLMMYTLGGRGRCRYPGGEILVLDGDVILIAPHTLHDYDAEPATRYWETLWVHFHPRADWHEWLHWPEIAPGLMRLTLPSGSVRVKAVARLFDSHHLAMSGLQLREELALNALEEVLLWCDLENPHSIRSGLDERVRTAMNYLCRNLSKPISLTMVAESTGLSISGIGQLFRKHMGMTPMQFLELQRLNRAKQLLELTPRAVQMIAAEVGFDNPFYFTLRFKRHTGLSPRDFRKRIRTDQRADIADIE